MWNPDQPNPIDFYGSWENVPDTELYGNGFRTQWEMFLRHHAEGTPWQYGVAASAHGVQLAELGMQSWAERRWIDIPALDI